MSISTQSAQIWSERGYFPDKVIRHGIKRLLIERLIEINHNNNEEMAISQHEFIQSMRESEVALLTDIANEQHYELPAEFFSLVLGKHNKYSCCYWEDETKSLDVAEKQALTISCERAQITNGHSILELGCGWGSLTLWMAEQYPDSQIDAVSNSQSQRLHIEENAKARGLSNVNIITCDMNDFSTDKSYDRVISIEMFEHMRNWDTLYQRVNDWLKTDGLFFKHIFVNRSVPYLFLNNDESDWMSRHFFSGGMMPSDDLPLHFQEKLQIKNHWRWSGKHYEKTSNAWLQNMDDNKDKIWPILENTYGKNETQKWWMRWRMFFMACAELFAFNHGQEWYVSHYLMSKK